MDGVDSGFIDAAEKCASYLSDLDDVLLISHIDADGLTSAGIASLALDREGIEHDTWFSKQLDEADLDRIEEEGYSDVLFTDFGSGVVDEINSREFTPVIADHHQPSGDCEYHLNPMNHGVDGSSEISGAGTTYILSRVIGGETNKDLAALAVVGAVGDMQNAREGRLTGLNRVIIQEGEEEGVLEARKDLMLYGRQTRPLHKLLEYSSDVYIPGITNNQKGASDLLRDAGIELKRNDEWRTWIDLSFDEKQSVINKLFERCMKHGISTEKIESLIGETYILTREKSGIELRDASEFSTLLNSTARYREADVGFEVCKGKRGEYLEEARKLLRNHRRNLRKGVDLVGEMGVEEMDNLQYFDAGDSIQDTIVGIIAGMSYTLDGVKRSKPIIGFADSMENGEETNEAKVSARATKSLVDRGLNLAQVMNQGSSEVGGDGGGHDIAAGATIPRIEIEDFLEITNGLIEEQLG